MNETLTLAGLKAAVAALPDPPKAVELRASKYGIAFLRLISSGPASTTAFERMAALPIIEDESMENRIELRDAAGDVLHTVTLP